MSKLHLNRANGLVLSLASVSALFFGCSLTGVTDVRVGECESDESCRTVLNPEDGNYEECAAYECVSNGEYNQCQKIDGERLDGLDNDCDYLVDESESGTSLNGDPLVSTSDFANGVPDANSASFASSEALSQVYVQQRGGTAFALDGESGNSLDVSMMAQAIDDSTTQNFVIELDEGCFTPSSTRAQDCDINEAVTAAGDSLGYFAQVKTAGCASGELRVGAIDPAAPSEFIDRGPGVRNPTYRGVATYGSLCSDNGRTACSEAKAEYRQLLNAGESVTEIQSTISAECGVSHPAIAATGSQALVAFLGQPINGSVCDGTDPVDVFGLLLHERIKSFGEEFVWADPSGDGVPDKLGTTRSGRPPAVQAVADSGFLVAHGNEDGEIRLAFVPLQATPPGNGGTECVDGDCDSREGFETDPIEGVTELTTLSSDGQPDGIRLSWLSVGDDEASILVTWVAGCADGEDGLDDLPAFGRIIRLDISQDTPEIIWTGPNVSLGNTKSFPLAVPSAQRFVVSGLERDGETATESDLSGFYVLTRPASVQAIRIASFDGRRLSSSEEIGVAEATFRYLTNLGESGADEFLMSQVNEGTITKGSFSVE